MPKAIFIPPPLSGVDIPPEGAEVLVKDVREMRDQWTSIGTAKHAMGFSVEYNGKEYSQMFSLDRPTLTGSIGRLLVSIGIDDTSDPDFSEKIKAFMGKRYRVVKRGGKLYWYP